MRKLLSFKFKQKAFFRAFIVGFATLVSGSLGHARHVVDIRGKASVTKEVEYAKAGEVRLTLEVYTPKISSDNPRPCIVWIHGDER